MSDSTDYTIESLFEMAKNDDSWEADPEMRVKVVEALKGFLYSM